MGQESETIQDCIEKARQRLYQIADHHPELWHPEVIHQSMVLDELINEYNRLVNKNQNGLPHTLNYAAKQ